MKKRLIVVISGLIFLLAVVGYSIYSISIQNGQDTVLQIYQKDMNGTPVVGSSPIKLVSKVGHRNPFNANIEGYSLKSSNPLGNYIPRKNKTIRLKYQSEMSKTEINRKLRKAKYINVASQQVSTTVLNNRQYEGKKGNQVVARVNISKNGITWSKLTISYPNVDMQRPSALYKNNKLYLFNDEYTYWTSDYSKWHRKKMNLRSSQFDSGKIYSQIAVGSDSNCLIVKSQDQSTKKARYYYAKLNVKKLTTASWKKITGIASKNEIIKNIQRLNNKYYVLSMENRTIKVYQSSKLSSKFKLVSSFKKSGKNKMNVAGLNVSSNGKYRIAYNERDNDDFQSTMYYQNLSKNLKPIGKRHVLSTDFLWYDFQDVYNKY